MRLERGQIVTMSRPDMYAKVWRTPAARLAHEFGISDVAIAKLCKKYRIPKPPKGYWARVQSGQKVQRTALPKTGNEALEIVKFQRWGLPRDHDMQDAEVAAMVAAEKETSNQVVVLESLNAPHPLVERTWRSLMSAAADDRGIARPRAKQCLDVSVSKANVDRAMRIMDAIVKGLEARGFPISVADTERGRATVVTVRGEPLKIGLSEKTDCKKRPPTAEQSAQQAKYGYTYYTTIYDYTPSGKLKLSILTGGYDNLRRNWTDLVHQRVENCLNRFIAALAKVAQREKADRIEAERRAREWQEETRRREEEDRRVEEERLRRDDLDAKALAWRKSQKLREYIAAFEVAAIRKLGKIDADSNVGLWLSWARRRADQVDPIDAALRAFDGQQEGQKDLDEGEDV